MRRPLNRTTQVRIGLAVVAFVLVAGFMVKDQQRQADFNRRAHDAYCQQFGQGDPTCPQSTGR
jgi:hypothetical protein